MNIPCDLKSNIIFNRSAGPVFECDISWDPYYKLAACSRFQCGGGNVVKLMASVRFCVVPETIIELELRLCVDIVSDILLSLGRLVPAADKIMNSYGIYAGCYRLAYAKYDMAHNRFKVIAGPHSRTLVPPFKASFGAKCECINIPSILLQTRN